METPAAATDTTYRAPMTRARTRVTRDDAAPTYRTRARKKAVPKASQPPAARPVEPPQPSVGGTYTFSGKCQGTHETRYPDQFYRNDCKLKKTKGMAKKISVWRAAAH